MKVYPVIADNGSETPIFQIDNVFISPRTVVHLLQDVDGVKDVQLRRFLTRPRDIHARFTYHGRPFIVWEPYGDNSRFWIGPADMVEGEPAVADVPPLSELRRRFEQYRPPLHRTLVGGLLTLPFLTRIFARRPPSERRG